MCQHDIPRGRDPKQYITKRPRNAIKLGDRGASTYPPPPLKNALKSRSRFIGFRYQINGNAFLPPSIFFFPFFFFYFRNSLDRDDLREISWRGFRVRSPEGSLGRHTFEFRISSSWLATVRLLEIGAARNYGAGRSFAPRSRHRGGKNDDQT